MKLSTRVLEACLSERSSRWERRLRLASCCGCQRGQVSGGSYTPQLECAFKCWRAHSSGERREAVSNAVLHSSSVHTQNCKGMEVQEKAVICACGYQAAEAFIATCRTGSFAAAGHAAARLCRRERKRVSGLVNRGACVPAQGTPGVQGVIRLRGAQVAGALMQVLEEQMVCKQGCRNNG